MTSQEWNNIKPLTAEQMAEVLKSFPRPFIDYDPIADGYNKRAAVARLNRQIFRAD